MSRKPYLRSPKPEMPLLRVVVGSKSWDTRAHTFYIPKFPTIHQKANIEGIVQACDVMFGVKCFVVDIS